MLRPFLLARLVVPIAVAAAPAIAAGEPAAPAPPAESAQATAPAATTSWLSGQVRSGRHRWIVGAAVLVRPQSGEPRWYVTSTDDKGTYRFEDLPEGSYRVEWSKPGFEPIVKERVEIRPPFRAVLEVAMEPASAASPAAADGAVNPPVPADPAATLHGAVADRDGTPLGEVRIRLVRLDGSVDPRDALTDLDGTFDLGGLPAGQWRLELLGAGYLPIRVPVALAGDGVVSAALVAQPPGYEPQPLDLIPPERPIPPPERPSSETRAAS